MIDCAIQAGPLLRLYGYWLGRKGRAPAPRRHDVRLEEIPSVALGLNVIEVEGTPFRFRHRIVGPELVHRLGRDVTDKYVTRDSYGAATREILSSLTAIATECRPYRRRARLDWNGQSWLMMESLELPLIDDYGRVDTILRASSFSPVDLPLCDRLEFQPILETRIEP